MPSQLVEEAKRALTRIDFDFIRGPHQGVLLRARVAELGEHQGPLGVDTETTGLDPRANQVRLIQIGTPEFALIVDLDGWRRSGERAVPWGAPGLQELRGLLEGGCCKVLQNAAFDLNFLRGEGITLGGPIFDTMVAAKLVNNGTTAKNDLGSIVERNLLLELPKELQKANWAGEISTEMVDYAARDVICLPLLVAPLKEALQGSRVKTNTTLWDLFQLEMSVLRPIALMQWHGFGFDREGAEALRVQLTEESEALKTLFLETLDQEIRKENVNNPHVWLPREEDGSINTREKDSGSIRLGTKKLKGFNPRSPKQMAERFEQAGIMLPPDEKGAPSLDQNLLAFLRSDYELIDKYMTWKTSVTKVSNIEKLLESIGPDGRIHCNYRQMGTETGRLSAASPNLQQVNRGKDFRSKFVAAPGYLLVVADFSQVELRVAAELSGEERMREAYRAGRDLHTETAALMTGVALEEVSKEARTSAKVANFGLLYGAGPATLQKQAVAQYGLDMQLGEARQIVEGFRAAYPTLYAWQQSEGTKTTKAVQTALGRRRMLVGFNDKYTTRINTQVQGTAGDIAKLAIARLWRLICAAPEGEARLIAMVHDEIVLEVRQGHEERWGQLLKGCMEEAGAEICKTVPIVAEVSWGKTWADAK
jgi:DNA polymerase-1